MCNETEFENQATDYQLRSFIILIITDRSVLVCQALTLTMEIYSHNGIHGI